MEWAPALGCLDGTCGPKGHSLELNWYKAENCETRLPGHLVEAQTQPVGATRRVAPVRIRARSEYDYEGLCRECRFSPSTSEQLLERLSLYSLFG